MKQLFGARNSLLTMVIIATMAQASFTKQSEFLAGEIQKEFDQLKKRRKTKKAKKS